MVGAQDGHRLEIRVDDVRGPEVIALLNEHLRWTAQLSPTESCHALDHDGLRQPGVTVWTVWEGSDLAACGALKELDPRHGEIKSMRTVSSRHRKGVATRLLGHMADEAKRRGYRRVSLETGALPEFEPARRLYRKFGFRDCPPFGNYRADPYSVYMSLEL